MAEIWHIIEDDSAQYGFYYSIREAPSAGPYQGGWQTEAGARDYILSTGRCANRVGTTQVTCPPETPPPPGDSTGTGNVMGIITLLGLGLAAVALLGGNKK